MAQPEHIKLKDFEEIYFSWFEDCDSIEAFVYAFNEVFSRPDAYQTDYSKKLDPEVIRLDQKLSCTAACLVTDLFVSKKLKDVYQTVFLLANEYPSAHSVIMLIPKLYQLPKKRLFREEVRALNGNIEIVRPILVYSYGDAHQAELGLER